jgi:glucosamine-6-phosphate deaminase
MHPWALIVVDEDATSGILPLDTPFCRANLAFQSTELHVKTVKYFKSIERVQDEVEKKHADLRTKALPAADHQVGSME